MTMILKLSSRIFPSLRSFRSSPSPRGLTRMMLSSTAKGQNALKPPLTVATSSSDGVPILLGALSATVIFAEMERRRCELEDKPKNAKRSELEKEATSMKEKNEKERSGLYDRIYKAEGVKDFVKIFNSREFQDALNRLAKARKGESSIEEWAENWARSKHCGDPIAEKEAEELDHDRKLCLQLLYELYKRWYHKRIDLKEVIGFRRVRVQRILDLCLVMDRANALYHMENNYSGERGIHWVAKQHLERSKEWRSLMGDQQCSMNKRLVWFYEIKEFGLQRETSTNLIPKWIKSKPCFTQIDDIDLEQEEHFKHRSLVGAPEKLEEPDSKTLEAISCKPCTKLRLRRAATKTPDKFVYESMCIHDTVQLARAFKYKNVNNGMVIFRGGRNYDTEKSGFMRKDAEERKRQLRKLLMCIHELIMYFQAHKEEEGSELFKYSDSVVSTIRALTMLQHYAPLDPMDPDEVPRVLTPLLDVTKNPNIAASFAFLTKDDKKETKPAIRFLLVGHPAPLKNEDNLGRLEKLERAIRIQLGDHPAQTTLGRLEKLNPGWLVQKLGDSEMLLVELQALLPASALRPQNQSGYILMHAKDLLAMHILCLRMAGEAAEKGQIDFDALLETEAAKSVVGEHSQDPGFDSLVLKHATVMLGEDKKGFFHEKMPTDDAKAKDLEGIKAMYPRYTKGMLYPSDDPTLKIVKTVVENVENELGY